MIYIKHFLLYFWNRKTHCGNPEDYERGCEIFKKEHQLNILSKVLRLKIIPFLHLTLLQLTHFEHNKFVSFNATIVIIMFLIPL